MRLYSILGILVLTIIGVLVCQLSINVDKRQYNDKDHLPFSHLVSEDSIFTFLAEEGFEYEFESGTKIKIPKGVLMEYTGELINGHVVLSFKTYRDAIDLLADGIYTEANSIMTKTAGAFKIEIERAGQKVFLDPTKSIEVKLACYEKEDNYDLNYYNKALKSWEPLYTVKPVINENYTQLERKVKDIKPKIKFPLDKNYFAFSYKEILEEIYDHDLTNVNHGQTQKKMKQYGLRWSNVNVKTFIDHQKQRQYAASLVWQNISRKPFPEWTKNKEGKLEQVSRNRYRLIVEDSIEKKKFSTQIKAIMPLKDLFSYGPGYWKSDYSQRIKKVSAAQKILYNMPSAFRSVRINGFGVYNWQKIVEEIESVNITAQLKVKAPQFSPDKNLGFYYMTGDAKGIAYYPPSKWNDFKFLEDPNASIFSILPNNKLLIFPPDRMRSIEFDQLQKMNSPSFIFKLEPVDKRPKSSQELRNILELENSTHN